MENLNYQGVVTGRSRKVLHTVTAGVLTLGLVLGGVSAASIATAATGDQPAVSDTAKLKKKVAKPKIKTQPKSVTAVAGK